jgi:hypothetical protein
MTEPATASPPADRDADVHAQRVALLHHFQEFERGFRRNYRWLWWGTLFGPWLIAVLLVALLWLIRGPEYTQSLLAAAAISFVFAGRFVILMEGLGDWGELLTPEDMFWMVTGQDVLVALFMAFHVGFLFKLPWIGPKLAELIVDGELILSVQPWMRRLTFWGLVAFIAFPLAATGSVGGAIFGRLLGLSRWSTFWGSVVGSVLGNAGMLTLADLVRAYLPPDSAIVQWGGLVLIVGIIVLLERRYSAMKREFLRDREEAGPADR